MYSTGLHYFVTVYRLLSVAALFIHTHKLCYLYTFRTKEQKFPIALHDQALFKATIRRIREWKNHRDDPASEWEGISPDRTQPQEQEESQKGIVPEQGV